MENDLRKTLHDQEVAFHIETNEKDEAFNFDENTKEWKEFETKRFYLNWWRYQYSHRHFRAEVLRNEDLAEDVDELLIYLPCLFEGLSKQWKGANRNSQKYLTAFFEFTNCLVYSFHKQVENDGFCDPKYESLVLKHGNPLEKINNQFDIEKIEFLHDWTVEYGFLIVPLLGKTDASASWEAFVTKTPEKVFGKTAPCLYTYPKFNESMGGVKISTSQNRYECPNDCDIAVYYHKGDVIDHLRKKVKEYFQNLPSSGRGVKSVGTKSDYDVAVYVNSNKCTPSYLMGRLEEQILWLSASRDSNRIWYPGCLSDEKSEKKSKSRARRLLEGAKKAEKLTKSWAKVDSNNTRRAIALALWDSKNIDGNHKKLHSLILEKIEELRCKHPKKLSSYYTHFNTKYRKPTEPAKKTKKHDAAARLSDQEIKQLNDENKRNYQGEKAYRVQLMGDGFSARLDIKKDMDDDYKLTEFCIRHGDYFLREERLNSREQEKVKRK